MKPEDEVFAGLLEALREFARKQRKKDMC